MIQLYEAGGAGDFTILQVALTHDQCRLLFENAGRLLTARVEPRATELLRTVPFRVADATNHFNDEFSMLHAVVPLEQYEQLKQGLVGSMLNVNGVEATRRVQQIVMDHSRLKIPLIMRRGRCSIPT